MNVYTVGFPQSQITLAVDINTFGLAASRAVVVPFNVPPSNGRNVAYSTNATGDIIPTVIGVASGLQNQILSIITKVDLWGDINQRKNQFSNTTTTYYLDGGHGGLKHFNNPIVNVDNNYTMVLFLMQIKLV